MNEIFVLSTYNACSTSHNKRPLFPSKPIWPKRRRNHGQKCRALDGEYNGSFVCISHRCSQQEQREPNQAVASWYDLLHQPCCLLLDICEGIGKDVTVF